VTRWTANTCRLRMWEGGYKESHLSFEHGLRLFLAEVFTSQHKFTNFQAVKKEKNETPERKCSAKEFRFTHLFRYKGNRVQDLKTELVASG